MLGVGIAGFPNLMQQESAGRICRTVQIVTKAAFFSSGRSNQGAEFRFEKRFLSFARAQQDNQRYGILWQPLVPA